MQKVAPVLLLLDFSAVKESLKTFGMVLKQILQYMFQTFVALLPHWGLEKKIVALLAFGVFLITASAIGIIVSAKKRNKLWVAICGVVEAVSSITTLVVCLKR